MCPKKLLSEKLFPKQETEIHVCLEYRHNWIAEENSPKKNSKNLENFCIIFSLSKFPPFSKVEHLMRKIPFV
jgi:hypothetical protein